MVLSSVKLGLVVELEFNYLSARQEIALAVSFLYKPL